jgi:hypothetical protein
MIELRLVAGARAETEVRRRLGVAIAEALGALFGGTDETNRSETEAHLERIIGAAGGERRGIIDLAGGPGRGLVEACPGCPRRRPRGSHRLTGGAASSCRTIGERQPLPLAAR